MGSSSAAASGNDLSFGRYDYSRSELIADGVVHAIGIVLALSAGSALLSLAFVRTGPWEYVAATFHVVSLIAVLSISMVYNLWPASPTKWLLRRLDHSAIFLLIAGTYTPVLAQLPDRTLAAGMTAFIWTAALIGVAIKLLLPGRFDRLAIVFYLAMGWSGVLLSRHLAEILSLPTLWLLAAGGAAYSLGVLFFIWQSLRFQNAAWHAFVVAGAGLHLAAMMDCLVIQRL